MTISRPCADKLIFVCNHSCVCVSLRLAVVTAPARDDDPQMEVVKQLRRDSVQAKAAFCSQDAATSREKHAVSPKASEQVASDDGVGVSELGAASGEDTVGECDALPTLSDEGADFFAEHGSMWQQCQDMMKSTLVPGPYVLPFLDDLDDMGKGRLAAGTDDGDLKVEHRDSCSWDTQHSSPLTEMEAEKIQQLFAPNAGEDLPIADLVALSETKECELLPPLTIEVGSQPKKRHFGEGLATLMAEKRRRVAPSTKSPSTSEADGSTQTDKLQTPKAVEGKRSSSAGECGSRDDSKHDLMSLAKSLKHSGDAMRDSCERHRPLALYFYLCSCINFLVFASSTSQSGNAESTGDASDPLSSFGLNIMQQTVVLLDYSIKVSGSLASKYRKRPPTSRNVSIVAAISVCESLFLALYATTKLRLSFARRRKLRAEYVRVQVMQEDAANLVDDRTPNDRSKIRAMNASTNDIIDETLPPLEAMSKAAAHMKRSRGLIASAREEESKLLGTILDLSSDIANWSTQMDETLKGACDKLTPLRSLLED